VKDSISSSLRFCLFHFPEVSEIPVCVVTFHFFGYLSRVLQATVDVKRHQGASGLSWLFLDL